jgi:threonine dehydratase
VSPCDHPYDRAYSRNSFIALHSVIHPRAVTEFSYRYGSPDRARVFVSFTLESPSREKEVSSILSALEKQDMLGFDISDDELAKSHARYMIGGCAAGQYERVFRFGSSGCTYRHRTFPLFIPLNIF